MTMMMKKLGGGGREREEGGGNINITKVTSTSRAGQFEKCCVIMWSLFFLPISPMGAPTSPLF